MAPELLRFCSRPNGLLPAESSIKVSGKASQAPSCLGHLWGVELSDNEETLGEACSVV